MDKGFKIKLLRQKKGFSQKEVALTLGISQSAYCKMEACEQKISIENCLKISTIIGVNLNDIINFESKYDFVEKAVFNSLFENNDDRDGLLKEIEELKKDNRILIRKLDKYMD